MNTKATQRGTEKGNKVVKSDHEKSNSELLREIHGKLDQAIRRQHDWEVEQRLRQYGRR